MSNVPGQLLLQEYTGQVAAEAPKFRQVASCCPIKPDTQLQQELIAVHITKNHMQQAMVNKNALHEEHREALSCWYSLTFT